VHGSSLGTLWHGLVKMQGKFGSGLGRLTLKLFSFE
jgi:hypothetical protein